MSVLFPDRLDKRTMTPATLFSLLSTLAMLAWVYLIAGARWTPKTFSIVRTAIPLLLSVGYLVCMISYAPSWDGGFGSIEEVRRLFTNDWALTAGWVHYLAFDFFVGCWILENAKQDKLSHWFISPILLATFMLGPIGYLLFSVIRRNQGSTTAA